ncbi:MAG: glutaredoxin 2 [Bdellovibrionales bacterium]|nr:glutaredoxin 2 [Bdellovibrionales bacterium]
MKLYVYDHCPYCVKARMIFGFKKIPLELITLANDDEQTPISLIGQKMLPILVEEGHAPMPESLDIVKYLDEKKEYGEPVMNPSHEDPRLATWLKEIRQYHYALAMPRWVVMGLEEFASPSAQEYFRKKKELSIGPFEEALKRTPELMAQAHKHLNVLEKIIEGEDSFWKELSYDDLHVFASLRCLTTVRGLELPPKINNYMNRMSERSQVPLHWNLAF